jgi:hypothetical protein
MDNDFNNLYHAEEQTGQVFITFAIFAIVIACLGLFGLVTYAAEQRTKEIGIRKVLGSSIGSIVALLSRDFVRLVLIASVIVVGDAHLAAKLRLSYRHQLVDLCRSRFGRHRHRAHHRKLSDDPGSPGQSRTQPPITINLVI